MKRLGHCVNFVHQAEQLLMLLVDRGVAGAVLVSPNGNGHSNFSQLDAQADKAANLATLCHFVAIPSVSDNILYIDIDIDIDGWQSRSWSEIATYTKGCGLRNGWQWALLQTGSHLSSLINF